MKDVLFEIAENAALTSNVYKMTLQGDTDDITA